MSGDVTVHWASRIRAAWQAAANSILEVGRLLAEAKGSLAHGQFGAMVAKELPFDRFTAYRLMAISQDERIVAHAQQMPNSWMTLYELTKLSDDEFQAKLTDGTINPDMMRKDVIPSALFPPAPGKPAEKPQRLPSPEDALAQSELTGEAVQARDGRFYSHEAMQKRFTTDLVDGFCDFAESIVVNLSDPRLIELCADPAVCERVRGHCERLAEEAWKFANRLEAQAA